MVRDAARCEPLMPLCLMMFIACRLTPPLGRSLAFLRARFRPVTGTLPVPAGSARGHRVCPARSGSCGSQTSRLIRGVEDFARDSMAFRGLTPKPLRRGCARRGTGFPT